MVSPILSYYSSSVPYFMQSLSEELREKTAIHHTNVAKHSFFKDLLNDTLETNRYHQYLVDLNVIYTAMEEGIQANLKTQTELQKINFPELNRSAALKEDLKSSLFQNLTALPSSFALDYRDYLWALSDSQPLLLAAHAYVRYLGDLSAAISLKRHVEKQWSEALHFYDFSTLLQASGRANSTTFKSLYKEKLDSLIMNQKERDEFVKEANVAFENVGKMLDAILELT